MRFILTSVDTCSAEFGEFQPLSRAGQSLSLGSGGAVDRADLLFNVGRGEREQEQEHGTPVAVAVDDERGVAVLDFAHGHA